MRRPIFVSLLPLFSLPALAHAAEPGSGITADAVKAHVSFLADDLLEGRDTGSRGHQIAARYVASQFSSMGLKPAVNGDWYQNVPFVDVKPNADASLTIDGTSYTHKKDAVVSGNGRAEGDIVFGGFCLNKPEMGIKDLQGLNIKGKIIACLSGFPKGTRSDIGAHLNAEKAKILSERGAIGLITIRTLEREKQTPWTRVVDYGDDRSVRWANADGSPFDAAPNIKASATLDRAAAAALFAGTGKTLDAILAEADRVGGKPKPFALKKRATIARTASLTLLAGWSAGVP